MTAEVSREDTVWEREEEGLRDEDFEQDAAEDALSLCPAMCQNMSATGVASMIATLKHTRYEKLQSIARGLKLDLPLMLIPKW